MFKYLLLDDFESMSLQKLDDITIFSDLMIFKYFEFIKYFDDLK